MIDPAGNIVVTGQDGGGGSGFLAKFSDEGQLIWLRELPKAPGVLAVDPMGNLYLGGGAPDGSQFGSLTLSARGETDAYVVKYDTDGNPVWLFGCGSEVTDSGWGLAVNREGYCYLAANAGLGGATATTMTVGAIGCCHFRDTIILAALSISPYGRPPRPRWDRTIPCS